MNIEEIIENMRNRAYALESDTLVSMHESFCNKEIVTILRDYADKLEQALFNGNNIY